MAAPLGTLIVELIRAQGIRGDEMLGLGKADPYAIINFGAHTQKSLTAKDQGSDPIWNQTFKFKILDKNGPMDLCIELYNKNTFKDNKLGTIRISLQEVFSKKKSTAVLYDVMRPNSSKIQGALEVQLTLEPKERIMSTSSKPPAASPLSKEQKPTTLIGEMETTSRRRSSSTNHVAENSNFSFPILSAPRMGYPAVQISAPRFDSAPVTGYPAIYTTSTYRSEFDIPKGITAPNSDHPRGDNLKSDYYLAGNPIALDKMHPPPNNSQAGLIQFEQRTRQSVKKSHHHKKNANSSSKILEPWKQPKASHGGGGGGGAKDQGRRHSKRRSVLAATVVVAEASAIILVQLAQVFVLATVVAVGGSC